MYYTTYMEHLSTDAKILEIMMISLYKTDFIISRSCCKIFQKHTYIVQVYLHTFKARLIRNYTGS